MTEPKYPCRNCIYFKVCGESTRTATCAGRQTKSEAKKKKGAANNGEVISLSAKDRNS